MTAASRLQELFKKLTDGQLTEPELEELGRLVQDDENEAIIKNLFGQELAGAVYPPMGGERLEALLSKTLKGAGIENTAPIRKMFPWRRVAVAAAVISLLVVGGLYISSRTASKNNGLVKTDGSAKPATDIAPGGNNAVLTLADGRQIILNKTADGTIAIDATAEAVKSEGTLTYNPRADGAPAYNTVSTPAGGQYKLVLADGSKVWLNAASSIRFPTAFVERTRSVAITGEAYFEVAHNAAKPFRVTANGVEVQVLGTHFNVNAYEDEAAVKTTLLEGSVRVAGTGAMPVTIKPGEQAQVEKGSASPRIIRAVNTDEVMAWKNGFFSFNQTDLRTIMRQLARWYDVEVVYEGKIPDRRFGGEISRNTNASQVLKILEESGIRFTIEGKRITVKP